MKRLSQVSSNQEIWDEVSEFVNKRPPPEMLEFKDKVLTPETLKDFEIIFLIHQAIKYPKRKKEVGSYNLRFISLFLNGFRYKQTDEMFLIDELPPIKYRDIEGYNTK